MRSIYSLFAVFLVASLMVASPPALAAAPAVDTQASTSTVSLMGYAAPQPTLKIIFLPCLVRRC